MLSPLALIDIFGWFASCISVDVTYAISGFLPIKIVSLDSDMEDATNEDNLNLRMQELVR